MPIPKNVVDAKQEAKRFLARVAELEAVIKIADAERTKLERESVDGRFVYVRAPEDGSAESASVIRASMDLTRALVKLRGRTKR